MRCIMTRDTLNVKIIHLETLCRGFDGGISLSGTLIRPACDLAILQWDEIDQSEKSVPDLNYFMDLISKNKWSYHPGLVCDSILLV